MATLFITAKPCHMPDQDHLGGWNILQEANEFYYQRVGSHHIFLHECLSYKEQRKLPVYKHKKVSDWINKVLSYLNNNITDFRIDDFYLIAHDGDLLRYNNNDEGLLPEYKVEAVDGGLQGIVPDKHIYVFMHSIQHDMFEELIKKLIDINEINIEAAIEIINNCTYETSVT